METKSQTPKVPDDDSTRTTKYSTSSGKGIPNAETSDAIVQNFASLRVTKSDHFPTDIIMEILKRLPVKTLARFLCVSKVWGSIISSRDFKKLFLAESSKRPVRLFFNFRHEKNSFFFTANQTLTPGEHSVATYHTTSPVYRNTTNFTSVHDLICYGTASGTELVVYNSTTKRSITLPKFKPGLSVFKHYLAYDPVDAVYKVLCMCTSVPLPVFRVLTLGNDDSWRVVKTRRSHSHVPFNSQICTDGVLYYDALTNMEFKEVVIMSFDVRSEKFERIKGLVAPDFPLDCISAMTRYEGKLAIVSTAISANGSMVLWVLEDAVKHQWSKKIFVLPNSWKSLSQWTPISSPPHAVHLFLNVTIAGEFILTPLTACVPPFYVLYYDPKRNSVRKVPIEGIHEHELLRWNKEDPWFVYQLLSSQVESLMFW